MKLTIIRTMTHNHDGDTDHVNDIGMQIMIIVQIINTFDVDNSVDNSVTMYVCMYVCMYVYKQQLCNQ